MKTKNEVSTFHKDDFLMINLIESEHFGHQFTTLYILNNIINTKDPITSCFVYRSEGLCVGYILFNNYDEQSEILMMGVKREFMRCKIGSALMNRVKELSKTITIEVRASNTTAISFYEKHGFKFLLKKEDYYDNEDGLYYIWKKN